MKNLRALLIIGVVLGLLASIGGGLLFVIGYLHAPNVNQPLWQSGRTLMLFGIFNLFVYIGIFFQLRKLLLKKERRNNLENEFRMMNLNENTQKGPRRPLFLVVACIVPPIFVPISVFIGQHCGPSRDAYGFGVLVTMVWSYLVGVGISWSFVIYGWVRGERPRFLAIAAVIIGLLPLYWVH